MNSETETGGVWMIENCVSEISIGQTLRPPPADRPKGYAGAEALRNVLLDDVWIVRPIQTGSRKLWWIQLLTQRLLPFRFFADIPRVIISSYNWPVLGPTSL